MTTHSFLKCLFKHFQGFIKLVNFQDQHRFLFFTFHLSDEVCKPLLIHPSFGCKWQHIPLTDIYVLCIHIFELKEIDYYSFSRYLQNNSSPF